MVKLLLKGVNRLMKTSLLFLTEFGKGASYALRH